MKSSKIGIEIGWMEYSHVTQDNVGPALVIKLLPDIAARQPFALVFEVVAAVVIIIIKRY